MVTAEKIYEVFDRDGDLYLSGRELRGRPDLLRELDQDGDGRVARDELGRSVNLVLQNGVDVTRDDFLRWDLDGDGSVGEGELPDGVLQLIERRERRPKRRSR